MPDKLDNGVSVVASNGITRELLMDFISRHLGGIAVTGSRSLTEAVQARPSPRSLIILSESESELGGLTGLLDTEDRAIVLSETVPTMSPAELSGVVTFARSKGELLSKVQNLSNGASGINNSTSTDPLALLSRREKEVFFMIVDGKPNRDIAKKLFVSPRTVETHRARVIKKLAVDSNAGIIRYAIRHRLVAP